MPEATQTRPGRLATPDHLAAACGVLAGVGGFVHGVGEVAQGSGATDGIVIDSWTDGRIAENLGGEPAMTLVPDVAVTGWSAIAVALAVVVWAGWFVDRRYGGTVLALLSVVMLLVGGGFGPPALGLLAALVAGSAHRTRRRDHPDRAPAPHSCPCTGVVLPLLAVPGQRNVPRLGHRRGRVRPECPGRLRLQPVRRGRRHARRRARRHRPRE